MTLITEDFTLIRKGLCRLLADTASEKGITHDAIALRTGFSRPNVTRMLAGHYAPSLDNFLKLADAIGCHFSIESNKSAVQSNYLLKTN